MSSRNIVATRATSTGDITTSASQLRGLMVATSGTAGRVTLSNGNGGDTQLDFDTGTGSQLVPVPLPAGGIPFPDGIYLATLTNVDGIVAFWTN